MNRGMPDFHPRPDMQPRGSIPPLLNMRPPMDGGQPFPVGPPPPRPLGLPPPPQQMDPRLPHPGGPGPMSGSRPPLPLRNDGLPEKVTAPMMLPAMDVPPPGFSIPHRGGMGSTAISLCYTIIHSHTILCLIGLMTYNTIRSVLRFLHRLT